MSNHPLLFFLHIPKTAGTSVNTVAKIEYVKKQRYPWDNVKWIDKTVKFDVQDERLGNSIKLVKGHFPVGIHEGIKIPFEYTTFLRDPIKRANSHFRQLYRMSNSLLSDELQEHGFDFVLEKYKNFAFSNLQSRLLAGGLPHEEISPDCLFEKARNNFDKFFPLFGLMERFDESILMMKDRYHWRYPPYYSVLNSVTEREATELDLSSIQSRLKEMNQIDQLLYDYAKERFDQINYIEENRLKNFRRGLKVFRVIHKGYLAFRPNA
ncbi:MAG: hypothetical protein KI791_14755 [Cyclobacteriaceae bacterium]|nr:hypothetical protein [Cyclobacteriaceae bacterium SS2]